MKRLRNLFPTKIGVWRTLWTVLTMAGKFTYNNSKFL